MNPTITNLIDENNTLKFTINNINTSLINGLRRIILSEISTIIFRTFPHSENKANIEINTSRFNNEIIKQRLGCIPIHINDPNFPFEEYVIEINVNNESSNIIYVTTRDFKVKNIKTETYLTDASTRQIFPPNPISNEFIDFVRLRPKLSENIPGEQLIMSCTLDKGIAKESGMYNVVSTGSYGATLDPVKIAEHWKEKEKELKTMSKEDVEFIKKDWMLLEATRLFIPDTFDFIVESVGVYSNFQIMHMACEIMVNKIKNLITTIQHQNIINPTLNTIHNSYDITLIGEDYTLGKVIEYLLYEKYFPSELSFCGFKKPHPHLDYCFIRLAFKEDVDNTAIITKIFAVCEIGINIFEKLKENFQI